MNKPMMIQDERLEKCKAQLAEAQASVTQLGIALVQEREKLAEAQADNAALIEALRWVRDFMSGEGNKWLPGSAVWHCSEQIKKTTEQALTLKTGASLLEELDQLRKVRDAAEVFDTWLSDWCKPVNGWARDEFRQALTQAKAGDK